METIMIDSGLVGLIIGRAGENLRRVETETGTRVQFMTGPENSGPYRLCKVTGPRQARDAAKAEINRIIADSGKSGRVMSADRPASAGNVKPSSTPQPTPKSGEESKQIMVPDRTVGLIIGRGGETIRDLQERSGCHVNITSEDKSVNGLRPVNLIGSPAATNMAKDLIMEIVDSDNKGNAGAGGGAGGGGGGGGGGGSSSGSGGMGMSRGGGGGGGGGGGEEKLNDTIRVPSEAVGMIIGKGGETIKDMQTVTGCKINIPQWSGQGQDVERITGLIGSRSAIDHAKRAIMEKVRAVVSHPIHSLSPLPS
jgi:far upstream element-binding protein